MKGQTAHSQIEQGPLNRNQVRVTELARGSVFYTFKAIDDNKVRIAKFYGYDPNGINIVSREWANKNYIALLNDGYVVERQWISD